MITEWPLSESTAHVLIYSYWNYEKHCHINETKSTSFIEGLELRPLDRSARS
jgi:hypothetical protein